MIQKVTPWNILNFERFKKENSRTDSFVSKTSNSTNPLVKPSLSSLQANYLVNRNRFNVSFGASNVSLRGDMNKPNLAMLSSLGPTGKRTHFYSNTADELAILLGPDKHALMIHEDGAHLPLLMRDFATNITRGNYERQGLEPGNVYIPPVIDVETERLKDPSGTVAKLLEIAKSNPKEKKIVFVNNFHLITPEAKLHKTTWETFLNSEPMKNVHVVGLIPKAVYEDVKKEKTIELDAFKSLGRMDFSSLSAGDTKALLKKEALHTTKLFDRYENVYVQLTGSAIDEIVDRSRHLQGGFPEKALKVLDLVVAAKAKGKVPLGSNFNLTIRGKDVERFFDTHSDLVAKMKPTDSRFKMAENVTTRLTDVGGISEIKENIRDGILAYLKNPKKYLESIPKAPKGILFYGESGTGKTHTARAIAGEAGVPFIHASGSDFVEKYVGVGAQRVRELFDMARKAAAASEKKAAIIFIDEIDAFGRKRTGESGGGAEAEVTLNQLLTEMDGFDNNSKTRIIVIAATNRKDILDPALLRPGRFDDLLEVPPLSGNKASRLEVLNIHSRKLPFASEVEKTKILEEASEMTNGMSGAQISEVLTKAAKVVAKRDENKVITHNDIVEGFLQVLAGPVKKNSDAPLEEIKKTVRHEGGHAVVIDTLKHDKVSFITLDNRGSFLGAVFRTPSQKSPNFKSVIVSAATNYAGGQAEPGFDYKGHAAGVSSDLENATNLIEKAVKEWGLGIHTPQVSIQKDSPLAQMYEKEVKADIGLFSRTAQKVSKLIVDFHKDFLDDYVTKFEANAGKGGNNLSGEEFSKLRQEWLVASGKIKNVAKLETRINNLIEAAQNSDKGFFTRFFKNTLRFAT